MLIFSLLNLFSTSSSDQNVFYVSKYTKNALAAGASSQTPLGELIVLTQSHSWILGMEDAERKGKEEQEGGKKEEERKKWAEWTGKYRKGWRE